MVWYLHLQGTKEARNPIIQYKGRNTKEETMMTRKNYEAPEMNIVKFQTTDIITTSTGEFDGEWVPIGGSDEEEL